MTKKYDNYLCYVIHKLTIFHKLIEFLTNVHVVVSHNFLFLDSIVKDWLGYRSRMKQIPENSNDILTYVSL
jgi:hypothetical protein